MKVETNAVLVEGVNRDGAEVTSTGRSFQCDRRRQGRRAVSPLGPIIIMCCFGVINDRWPTYGLVYPRDSVS